MAVCLILVIIFFSIRICFEFRASDFEFGLGLSGLGTFFCPQPSNRRTVEP